MKIFQNTTLLSFIAISLFISLLTGCGTDSDLDDHDEAPVGVFLSINGNELAKQEETTVSYTTGNSINVIQGTTLGPIMVKFIAEDGDRFTPHTDEGFSLDFSSSNGTALSLIKVGTNEWTIQLVGNATGESTITFDLMHAGHSDFTSRPFQVQVVAQ